MFARIPAPAALPRKTPADRESFRRACGIHSQPASDFQNGIRIHLRHRPRLPRSAASPGAAPPLTAGRDILPRAHIPDLPQPAPCAAAMIGKDRSAGLPEAIARL